MCGEIGGSLVGSLIQSGLGFMDDDRAARQRKQQADVYERNAEAADNRAEALRVEGERKERLVRREAAREEGRARSLLASSGVAMDSGSALDTLMDGRASSELEAQDVVAETRSRVADSRYEAEMSRYRSASLLAADEDDARFRRAMRTGLIIGRGVR